MVDGPHMDTRIAKRLIQKKKKLDTYRPLESFTVQRLHADLRLLATYHSNAIEGNTLTLHETQMVLEYGITVDGRSIILVNWRAREKSKPGSEDCIGTPQKKRSKNISEKPVSRLGVGLAANNEFHPTL